MLSLAIVTPRWLVTPHIVITFNTDAAGILEIRPVTPYCRRRYGILAGVTAAIVVAGATAVTLLVISPLGWSPRYINIG